MRIKEELYSRDSLSEFEEEIRYRIDACTGIIHVRTTEILRAAAACRRIALSEGSQCVEWDINRGFVEYLPHDLSDNLKEGTPMPQLPMALKSMFDSLIKEKNEGADGTISYRVFIDPSKFWESPSAIDYIRKAAAILPQTHYRMIMITGDVPPPADIGDIVSTVTLRPPGFNEIRGAAEGIFSTQEGSLDINGMDEESLKALCYAASGMSQQTFEDTLSLAMMRHHDGESVEAEVLIREVSIGKTEVVNRNDILELYPPESIENVGGMENLKKWISSRADCYSDEAADFGIEPPKGMVFVGPPGTGKSLAAKAVASVLRVPLVRLDFGRVFNSLVGQSEQRIREALKMCEHMAPVVLFVDEIDKALGGSGGGGDAGTSSRVLGTFLTWLNDCKAPVFTMVTANNISHLPPELMRRGRFDAIFSTGMPTEPERLEVLKIHMRKRGWDPDEFTKAALNKAVTASRGYVPAEIESAVKDGLIAAYNEGETFTPEHVVEALKVMVPLSTSYAEQIQVMTAWAAQNATPASEAYDADGGSKVTKLEGRRTRKRTPTKH
jgi:AAA+ superfamily predicted ATPase